MAKSDTFSGVMGQMIVYISRLLSALSDGNIQSQKRREINTMTYTNIRLFTANGIPEALSNLWYGTDCSVVEIQDAIEDAENAADLLRRIQKMKLLRKVALDRETEQRVRFKTTDCWGNTSYLEIRK